MKKTRRSKGSPRKTVGNSERRAETFLYREYFIFRASFLLLPISNLMKTLGVLLILSVGFIYLLKSSSWSVE